MPPEIIEVLKNSPIAIVCIFLIRELFKKRNQPNNDGFYKAVDGRFNIILDDLKELKQQLHDNKIIYDNNHKLYEKATELIDDIDQSVKDIEREFDELHRTDSEFRVRIEGLLMKSLESKKK